MRKLNAHLEGRTPDYRSEHRLRCKDGSWIWVLDTGRVVDRDANGRPLRALGVHVDITATKEMERKLRESDQRFLTIFDQTFHLSWVLSPEGQIINANQTALVFANAASHAVIGQLLWQSSWHIAEPDGSQLLQASVNKAACGQFVRFELMMSDGQNGKASNSTFVFDFSIKPVYSESGRVTSLIVEASDISDAVRTRETLRVAQNRLDNATRNANLGVWDWNPQTDEAWFNDRWFSMLGYGVDELPYTGQTWVSLLHPDDHDEILAELMRHIEGQTPEFRGEFRMRCKDGSWCWILTVGRVTERDALGNAVRVSGVHFDETERRQMQMQLAQAQRLESIGNLAAGVAHEINTPMQFVSDNLEFLIEGVEAAESVVAGVEEQLTMQEQTGSSHLSRAWLEKLSKTTGYTRFRSDTAGAAKDCRDGCQRVVTIVHAMRQLSHPGTDAHHLADINEVISGAAIVTRNRWKFVADLQLHLDPGLPQIECRAVELSQVIVNMIVNAADAMPEPEPGSGTISGLITINTKGDSQNVIITVSDNGSGIRPDILQKIFDPFFTTKPVGKGTGQGLSIAHDIVVNRHRGKLSVESQLGEGTAFTIVLPQRQTEQVIAHVALPIVDTTAMQSN